MKFLVGMACGVVLGVVGLVGWFVRFINKDGGIFR